MLKRSFSSRDRSGKGSKISKRSYKEHGKPKLHRSETSPPMGDNLTSPIITLVVGREQRLFAAHEDVLCQMSPFFTAACKGAFFDSNSKRIDLPDEEPEILSAVLEYLYKGDYTPRLLQNKRHNTWELEAVKPNPAVQGTPKSYTENTDGRGGVQATMYHSGVGGYLLRDTVIYCAADKYGLEELKRLCLRKQGLQTGIEVATILRSARYAYENTPDTDSRLRAHYLALIIRCRKTFKRSGTMQMEMEAGGKLFFDLFVAMVNHLDDIVELTNSRSPRAI